MHWPDSESLDPNQIVEFRSKIHQSISTLLGDLSKNESTRLLEAAVALEEVAMYLRQEALLRYRLAEE